MASGLPVLAPDAGGPRDLVLHGRTGFLLPADRAHFATGLLDRVDELRDPALREGSAPRHARWCSAGPGPRCAAS